MSDSIWISLYHPCFEIDVWRNVPQEHEKTARGQGYIPLNELRKMVEASPEAQIAGAIIVAGIWEGWGDLTDSPFEGLEYREEE